MRTTTRAWALCLGLTLAGSAAGMAKDKLPGPLLEGLGNLHHPVSTSSRRAQRYFDQGLILAYAFNHKEAIRAFESAAVLDDTCAMAYWGAALAYGPHVNKPMGKEDNERAWAALQKAIAKKDHATARERAYIDALSKRYTADFKEDRSELDKSYAAAMREVVRHYPDDLDAQTLFAESLMDTMPWDYWLKDRSPKPETEEAFAALRSVLARNPDHPGANHYYIHAVEAGPHPEWGLPSADRLKDFAPTAGHLVHMPSHIYIRVGQYDDATAANERAIKADQSYLRQSREQGFYPGVYYPHNIHFLWWAQLFQGRSAEALKTANKAAQYARDNYCGTSKAVEAPRFRHLPWLTMMRFGKWDELLRVPEPAATNDFAVDRAVWHFTRGLAFAARNDAESAAREHAGLAQIVKNDDLKKLESPQFPVVSLLTVADQWLGAKVAAVRGDQKAALELLEQAVKTEDAIPYMEPSYWPLPVRPTLGAMLLKSGDSARAEQIFREDLKRMPRNAWGLLGLEQSLRAQQRNEAAEDVARQFNQSWKRADAKLDLAWF